MLLFSGDRAYRLLQAQTDLGVRAPGTPGHEAVVQLIRTTQEALGLEVTEQRWQVPCGRAPGGVAGLTNLLATILPAERGPGAHEARRILLGTHYDTRWIADREPDPDARARPILGANDGGSGTAILLELARVLCERPPRQEVVLAFFDGEDLGDLDGHPFAVGSAHFAANPGSFAPDEVIALDMVGGAGMRLNLEGNSLMASAGGRTLFQRLFALGRSMGLPPFFDGALRWIWSDHGPFLEQGIPAVLLIDIDYPWWHTQGDRPEHCSAASLEAVGRVLEAHLAGGWEPQGHGRRHGRGHGQGRTDTGHATRARRR